MKTWKQIMDENPKANKFVVWRPYSNSYDLEVHITNTNDIDIMNPPSKKINWLKVIFNKKYRHIMEECFNYANYHADTYRGESSNWVAMSDWITNIPFRFDNSIVENVEIKE